MAKQRAQVLTTWAEGRYPILREQYALEQCHDVTGTPSANIPPIPAVLVVEVIALDTVITQIETDTPGSVYWAEDVTE